MAERKVIFVLVEGPSDETAIGAVLDSIYKDSQLYVHVFHGDITTEGVSSKNGIVSKIGKLVKSYADNYHFRQSDFAEIIHLVDTDGAFVPDQSVLHNEIKKSVYYTDENIYAPNPEAIVMRNHRKSSNLRMLIQTNTIWNIPYHVYYMSCNLDHVLHNKQNSNNHDKESDAYHFAVKYKNIPNEFIHFIKDSEFSVNTDYRGSWDFIMQSVHSLERHTNICIRFEDTYSKIIGK